MAIQIPDLPIREKADELKELITANQVIVVAGETGSGKTTQLPRICHELGLAESGKIAVTQPRRIAATSTATRVAEEMGCQIGTQVGYRVRFNERVQDDTEILFMTDGMLLQEMVADKMLARYSVIIVDEAHERSLNIDFLLGYFRKLLKQRPELKLIISSATIDTELFSKAFDDAPIMEVSGRLFPVEVIHDPIDGEGTYIDQAVKAVADITGAELGGDMLIFMPTERDIRELQDRLTGKRFPDTIVLPLFARLTSEQQNKIFHTMSKRKIVIATNIAETSITVPGIRFVIDSGLARINRYSPSLRTNRLPIEMISQAEAKQRMGRCGRVAEGICIRLYSEDEFNTLDEFRTAEIRRSNLAGVILSLLDLKLGDIERFPFLEKPETRAISDAFSQLYELSAVDTDRRLTKLGWQLAKLPLEPHISRMILQAEREGVVEQVAVIAAGLSIVDPRERPQEQAEAADLMHAKFVDGRSDFLTLLKLWESYHREWESLKTQNRMRKYCKEHFLNYNRIREWMDVYKQISGILKRRQKSSLKTHKKSPHQPVRNELKRRDNHSTTEFSGGEKALATAVHRAILAGLVSSIAKFDAEAKSYRATRNRLPIIFPGSVLAKKKKRPDWIMAQEIVETSRVFARTVAPIDPRWVEEFVPHLLKHSYGTPFYSEEKESVLVEQRSLFSGLPIIEGRKKFYGSINKAEASRIFIQSALVEGLVKRPLPFLKQNLRLQKRLLEDEAKLRTKGYMISDEQIVDLYEPLLEGVASVRDLSGLIRKQGNDSFLRLKREELLIDDIPDESTTFPQQFQLGEKQFPLSYSYKPGEQHDGVSVTVPLGEVAFINSKSFSWLVRPLWPEKISVLLKDLPKSTRVKFIPINQAAEKIAGAMSFGGEGFIPAMIDAIRREFGIVLTADQFDEASLPDHLKIRVVVKDKKGDEIAATRAPEELNDLNKQQVQKGGSGIKGQLKQLEERGIKRWNMGDLPDQMEVSRSKDGLPLYGYPALRSGVNSVTLVYETTPESAAKTHAGGVVTLLKLTLQEDLDWLDKDLKFPKRVKMEAMPYGGIEGLRATVRQIIREQALLEPVKPPRTEAAWKALHKERREILRGAGHNAVTTVEKLFDQLRENRSLIKKLQKKFTGKNYINLASELRGELDVYLEQFTEGFFPYPLFVEFPRLMKAFYMRIEKAFTNTAKYRKQELIWLRYQDEMPDLIGRFDKSRAVYRHNVLDYMVMVEELGVMLFAHPEMKPRIPVSEKRLDTLLQQLKER